MIAVPSSFIWIDICKVFISIMSSFLNSFFFGFLGVNQISIFVRIRHNDTKNMTPLPSANYVISRFLTKSIVFQKIFWMFLGYKKANDIFEELSNLYLILLIISFFLLLLWITSENRTKLKKLFIWTTKSGGTQHYRDWILDVWQGSEYTSGRHIQT